MKPIHLKLFISSILVFSQGCQIRNNVKHIHSNLCIENSCPEGVGEDDQIVNHNIIILANNPDTKFADWVAYRVEKSLIDGPKRKRNWKQDPSINSSETLPPSAYKGVHAIFHTDRGHQAPLGSFKGASNYYVVNYLSNITPQKSDLNKGAWARLESAIRNYVKKKTSVFVVTGPYYERGKQPEHSFPNYPGTLMIPIGYFKVVSINRPNGIYATAFVFPQGAKRTDNYCSYLSKLSKIKELTGIKVLPSMPVGNLDSDLGC